ncbi:hypothetical protein [Demequina sp. NBRC 110056]|uniref:hypothetical protein n=1 Tax=Demequina sp. NBRC 110056 TaxID=1570345 RepID=UPI0009FF086D|nr:hypothetical protein [Demequina sp. NBRC 110056]
MTTAAAILFTAIIGLLAIFQLALAAGAPLGRFAFGGQHDGALPRHLRIASALTVPVYAFMAITVLDNAGLTDLLGDGFERIALWVIIAFLALNTVPNAISRSRAERFTMTPTLVVLTACALIVALTS